MFSLKLFIKKVLFGKCIGIGFENLISLRVCRNTNTYAQDYQRAQRDGSFDSNFILYAKIDKRRTIELYGDIRQYG